VLLLSWEIGLEKKGKSKSLLNLDLFVCFLTSRGLIFGIWSACASVGNIFGALLAAAFLKYGYDYAFLVCCILLLCFAIICFFAIVPSPADVGTYRRRRKKDSLSNSLIFDFQV
jgi:sugar phosphate permease